MMPTNTGRFQGTESFMVSGMTCSHCEHAVTAEITAVDGVTAVSVDLASWAVTVTTARPVDRAAVAAAVDEAGYTLAS